MLGVSLDPAYVHKLEQTPEAQIKENWNRTLERQKTVEEVEWTSKHPDSDESFYLIAGYTSGGAPYGITWEQAEKEGLSKNQE